MEHRVRIAVAGSPDVMAYESFHLPAPGPGEARVRHRAIGVNMIDTYHRSGLYAVPLPATVVITPDFQADDKWAELRHLPLALGFTGAWSMPIFGAAGEVLGTFGTYFRARREPSPEEVTGIENLAAVAALALAQE